MSRTVHKEALHGQAQLLPFVPRVALWHRWMDVVSWLQGHPKPRGVVCADGHRGTKCPVTISRRNVGTTGVRRLTKTAPKSEGKASLEGDQSAADLDQTASTQIRALRTVTRARLSSIRRRLKRTKSLPTETRLRLCGP